MFDPLPMKSLDLLLRRYKVRRLLAFVLLLCATSFASSGHTASHSSSSHSSKSHPSNLSTASKPVHVRGYTRKDGEYVAPYDRRTPGTAGSRTPDRTNIPTYHRGYLAEGYTAHSSVAVDKHGEIKRSKAARDAFERKSPCPSTGRTSGRCPGYIVDHVKALECGGADAPSNMQWQTVTEAKAKDKTERNCRL